MVAKAHACTSHPPPHPTPPHPTPPHPTPPHPQELILDEMVAKAHACMSRDCRKSLLYKDVGAGAGGGEGVGPAALALLSAGGRLHAGLCRGFGAAGPELPRR
jgi:hypothetical protein